MAAYIIARVNVTDMNQYKEYTKVTPGVIAKFGGKFSGSRRGDNYPGGTGPDATSGAP